MGPRRAGRDGKKRHRHPPEVRAAVMAAVLEGQGVNETAKEYNIPPSTVSRWKALARAEAGRSDDVGALLLAYLRENLATLTAQARVFGDGEWIREQGAADVAVLHGVLTDKAVRLLEALEDSGVQPAGSTDGHRNRGRRHG
jgi:transposase-like protein